MQGVRGGWIPQGSHFFSCTVWSGMKDRGQETRPHRGISNQHGSSLNASHTAGLSNELGIQFQMPGDSNETRRGGFKVWKPTRTAQGFRKMIRGKAGGMDPIAL